MNEFEVSLLDEIKIAEIVMAQAKAEYDVAVTRYVAYLKSVRDE